jgi:hypothetical protein
MSDRIYLDTVATCTTCKQPNDDANRKTCASCREKGRAKVSEHRKRKRVAAVEDVAPGNGKAAKFTANASPAGRQPFQDLQLNQLNGGTLLSEARNQGTAAVIGPSEEDGTIDTNEENQVRSDALYALLLITLQPRKMFSSASELMTHLKTAVKAHRRMKEPIAIFAQFSHSPDPLISYRERVRQLSHRIYTESGIHFTYVYKWPLFLAA